MRSVLLQQRLLKFDFTLSSAWQGVLSSSPRDHEFLSDSEREGFKITNRAAVGVKEAFWERVSGLLGKGEASCEGCLAFGAHIAHRQGEDALKALIFPDAWTIPRSSSLPRTLLHSVWLHLRQVRWKLTTGCHWFSNTRQARMRILME